MSDRKLKKCYFVHDNGGKPFKVCNYNDNSISVFINQHELKIGDYDEEIDRVENKTFTTDRESEVWKLWKSFSYQKIWIPKYTDQYITDKKSGLGNSILIEIADNKYIYIGHKILEFSTKIPILDYQSPIGNSDSPYPYARTSDSYIVFLPSNRSKSKVQIELDEMETTDKTSVDPYQKYYEKGTILRNSGPKFAGKNIKSMKILHVRLADIPHPRREGEKAARRIKAKYKTVRDSDNRSTRAKKTSRSNQTKKTTRSTRAKKTTRSTRAKKTTRSTKAKKTSRSTKAKKTSRSRR